MSYQREILPNPAQVHLNDWGLISISGADAQAFLQGQLSCDMTAVDETTYQRGIYANLQGRVVASLICFKWHDNYYCLLAQDLVEKVISIFAKYAIFSKVEIKNDSELDIHGVYGNDLASVPIEFPEPQHVMATESLICLALPGSLPRYAIITTDRNIEIPLAKAPAQVWRELDILAGIANIFTQTSESFLPHRLNYHLIQALNFQKGCYFGQEIIARVHYRSELKHHARIIEYSGKLLSPGDELLHPNNDKRIAHVIDSIASETNQNIAFITIADEYLDLPELKTADNLSFSITYVELPYSLS